MAAFFADQGAGRTPTALVPPTVLKHRNVPARAQANAGKNHGVCTILLIAQCLFFNGCLLKKTSLLKIKKNNCKKHLINQKTKPTNNLHKHLCPPFFFSPSYLFSFDFFLPFVKVSATSTMFIPF